MGTADAGAIAGGALEGAIAPRRSVSATNTMCGIAGEIEFDGRRIEGGGPSRAGELVRHRVADVPGPPAWAGARLTRVVAAPD